MADILVADDTQSIRNTLSILLAEEGHDRQDDDCRRSH